MKTFLAFVLVLFICMPLSGCGSGEATEEGWKLIHPKMAPQCSFELPEPVSNPPREGREVYEANFDGGKSKIGVAFYGKLSSPTNPNATDAELMNEQQKSLIGLIQANLVQSGYTVDLQLDGDLPVKEGLGQQVRLVAGDQFVVTQAYMTPRGFSFVKIDNADQTNPVVDHFMKSFEP